MAHFSNQDHVDAQRWSVEGSIGHRSVSTLVHEEHYRQRRIVLLRAPQNTETSRYGFLRCDVYDERELAKARHEGWFEAKREQGKIVVGGFLIEYSRYVYGGSGELVDVDAVAYLFDDRAFNEEPCEQHLLAWVRRLLDFDYDFPSEIGARRTVSRRP